MKPPIDWLLAGDPWVAYRTRLDLLREDPASAMVQSTRREMLDHPQVQALITELGGWPGTVISSHKSAGQPFHKLTFQADIGLTADDPGMGVIIERIFQHRSLEGPFQLPTNIPGHYGGSGIDEWAWALCDAPLIVYALAKFGLQDSVEVKKAVEYLAGLIRPNGFPCAVSKELGTFRGPGRKDDPCPFANLAMLKALSVVGEYRDSPEARIGTETLLALWQESERRHPYIFYMGTDFRKLKVPFIWYDLMHVLEVLTNFPWFRGDPRLEEMVRILREKADEEGRFSLESIWTAWKGWEFAQKKEPSRWLTLLAWRILHRL